MDINLNLMNCKPRNGGDYSLERFKIDHKHYKNDSCQCWSKVFPAQFKPYEWLVSNHFLDVTQEFVHAYVWEYNTEKITDIRSIDNQLINKLN